MVIFIYPISTLAMLLIDWYQLNNYQTKKINPSSHPIYSLNDRKDVNQLIIYPNPPINQSDQFYVQANDQDIYVYNAGSFLACSFAFVGNVLLTITYKGMINRFAINPASYNISATQISESMLIIKLTDPRKFELVINNITDQYNNTNQILYIFADPPETHVPHINDTQIYYFPPGLHTLPTQIFHIEPTDTHCGIYLSPGAQLDAVLYISGKRDFKVWGRGFLRNPFSNKSHTMLEINSGYNITLEDIHLYDSDQHVMAFSSSNSSKSHSSIMIHNIKSFHSSVNSDGLSFFGPINNVIINNSFIIGNDNLIVLGGSSISEPVGPYNNTIINTSFIKWGHAGNFCFLQGNSPPLTGGNIGPNNRIYNCDIIRTDREKALISAWFGTPSSIQSVIVENIRVQSFSDQTGVSLSQLIRLEQTDQLQERSLILRNIDLPYSQSSYIANGSWTVTFDHVRVKGKLAKNDADLNLTVIKGSKTIYLYDN